MSAHEQHPVEVDPAALQSARVVWSGFTHLMKYTIISVVVILVLMAVFLT